MRDARRIRERHDDNPKGRLGVLALVALGTVVVSYNIGLQVGMSRAVPTGVTTAPVAAPLAKLDQAQQKHDAMQFYTRLNQEAPKPSSKAVDTESELDVTAVAEPQAQPEPAVPAVDVPQETAQLAIARLGKDSKAGQTETSAEVKLPETSGNFTVQVSAFQTEEEAEAYKASLNRKGYHPYVVAAEIPGKGMWYRVRVGRFDDKVSANEAKAQLALVNIPSFVVAAH